ncbi:MULTISPECIES: (4Fe-4S)-binding protein [unclassified Enterococcus]|uniref:(4Fe-4S)-binding protein n=1 Tax=unclassified Enterococcus TaxID=2608891 RepID=UPI0015524A8B|nr:MULTISPECIES: (4Fe-4S)-binding protein [unclassified Enterococcus]MBS7577180.1 (4Fe-4S)-binding protein [Enterococcus sp. MMGLQ5-2]MBS7584727.1 (4Fe-4S)-binding protein [Enterococcus sp. MMGLQ5-1]NPD12582.1 hypothetical protein [Enterococcus sp. MMGLQ5-1]NPD37014.1 hypothetical protein [Enterococcus sp. MMGLQ5-2]
MKGNKINQRLVTEALLLASGYRKYTGEKLDIYYSSEICAHIGNCVRGNPVAFQVGRRPWIMSDKGECEATMAVVNSCPTGALKYIVKE